MNTDRRALESWQPLPKSWTLPRRLLIYLLSRSGTRGPRARLPTSTALVPSVVVVIGVVVVNVLPHVTGRHHQARLRRYLDHPPSVHTQALHMVHPTPQTHIRMAVGGRVLSLSLSLHLSGEVPHLLAHVLFSREVNLAVELPIFQIQKPESLRGHDARAA